MKEKLLGKTPDELKVIAQEAGLPAFAGKQMAQWLYQKRVADIAGMTNLSKQGREALSEKYEVGLARPLDVQTSADGTRKYLFPVNGDASNAVEAVMIPDEDRKTLCVSSQAGCKMSCKFCMTGRQGFHGNLSAADILSQFFAVEEAGQLTNTVFMGMGEPLDNWEEVRRVIEVLTADWGLAWSPKRVTLSTIGVLPKLKQFLEDATVPKIGLSLRDDLMMLHKLGDFNPGQFIDLQDHVREIGVEDMSLQKLYANFFGQRISKREQLTNWEADVLNEKQKMYAATDAWSCIMLYEELMRLEQTNDYELIKVIDHVQADSVAKG